MEAQDRGARWRHKTEAQDGGTRRRHKMEAQDGGTRRRHKTEAQDGGTRLRGKMEAQDGEYLTVLYYSEIPHIVMGDVSTGLKWGLPTDHNTSREGSNHSHISRRSRGGLSSPRHPWS